MCYGDYYGYCDGWCEIGGCMSFQRMIHRNSLTGNYGNAVSMSKEEDVKAVLRLISGDMRRMERDQRDDRHVARIALKVGITPEQARAVLDLVFDKDCEGQVYYP